MRQYNHRGSKDLTKESTRQGKSIYPPMQRQRQRKTINSKKIKPENKGESIVQGSFSIYNVEHEDYKSIKEG